MIERDVSRNMLYRKMIKNAILNQYYANCISINEYFNRKVPLSVSVFLSAIFQMSGGVLLILLAITASDVVNGNIFITYFSVLALVQAFFQAKRDYKTFDSLYEQSMFVYGYHNRKAVTSNAIAYSMLNMVNNPMVFVPHIIYPMYLNKNILIMIFNMCVPFIIYNCVFFYSNNLESDKQERHYWGEVMYALKSLIVIVILTYVFRYLLSSEGNISFSLEALNEEFKIFANSILNNIIPWLGGIICIIGALFIIMQFNQSNTFRCICYGSGRKTIWKSKWVLYLAELCKDKKVKSDLLIIGRRRDIWKYNPNAAFIFPNTSVLIIIFIINMVSYCKFNINVGQLIVTALVFEMVVIGKFVFNNMSFMLFHNAELGNIELYKRCNKDKKWLFWKKVKLMCWLVMPANVFTSILFIILAFGYKEYAIAGIIIPLVIVGSFFLSFIYLYWMFYYKVSYTEYEEFGTKKIKLSLLNRLTSLPIGLMCLPFFMNIFNCIIKKEIFSGRIMIRFLISVIIFSIVFSFIVFRRSLRKNGK